MAEAALVDTAWLTLPLNIERSFATDYADAQRRFRDAAAKLGAQVKSYPAPLAGPDGEALSTDTVWLGATDASRVMVLTSGTHGVEGFCGSGAQIDFMLSGGPGALPADTAVLIVHAVNPWGFAHLRRVTQENVDLNRNGVDFADPPQNPGYLELKDALSPASLEGPVYDAARATIAAYRQKHGDIQYNIARGSGQYVDEHGLHFGGFGPTWSRLTMEKFIADYGLATRKQVAVIDYHTGLGPYGYGEPICGCRPTEPGRDRGRAWYGPSMTEPMLGTSTSVVIPGLVQYIWLRELGAERLTFIALEYGTYPRNEVQGAADAESWLFKQNIDRHDEKAKAIKAEFRRVYYPDTPSWKEMVLLRNRQVIGQTLQGLAAVA